MGYRVNILEACDGFTLQVIDEDDILVDRWHFDQEDSVETMTEFFDKLGIQSQYEEDY